MRDLLIAGFPLCAARGRKACAEEGAWEAHYRKPHDATECRAVGRRQVDHPISRCGQPIVDDYALTCLLTSLVMSNMLTCALPKIGRRRSSALIIRLFF